MTTIDTTQRGQLFSAAHGDVVRHTNTGHGACRLSDHNVVDMAPLAAARLALLDDLAVTSRGVVSSWAPTCRGVQHPHSPAPLAEAVSTAAVPMHPSGTGNHPAATVASRHGPTVHASGSSQPAPAPLRRNPLAGAPRR